jgi:hypothetical protein
VDKSVISTLLGQYAVHRHGKHADCHHSPTTTGTGIVETR